MTDDLTVLQGSWRIIAGERNGSPIPPSEYDQCQIRIVGDRGIVTQGTESMTVAMSLDSRITPKQIDSTYLSGPQEGKTLPGIYELEPDGFRMCRVIEEGVLRPSSFETWPDSGRLMVVWQREDARSSTPTTEG